MIDVDKRTKDEVLFEVDQYLKGYKLIRPDFSGDVVRLDILKIAEDEYIVGKITHSGTYSAIKINNCIIQINDIVAIDKQDYYVQNGKTVENCHFLIYTVADVFRFYYAQDYEQRDKVYNQTLIAWSHVAEGMGVLSI